MSVFADSSALVTLYADEPGRDHLRTVQSLVVSALARVEVPSALWRKHRLDDIDASDATLLVADFEADYQGSSDTPPRFAAVPVTSEVLESAARIVARHQLRAFDATQLAAALAARGADPGCRDFAAYDRALRHAAAVEGFRLIPERVS